MFDCLNIASTTKADTEWYYDWLGEREQTFFAALRVAFFALVCGFHRVVLRRDTVADKHFLWIDQHNSTRAVNELRTNYSLAITYEPFFFWVCFDLDQARLTTGLCFFGSLGRAGISNCSELPDVFTASRL